MDKRTDRLARGWDTKACSHSPAEAPRGAGPREPHCRLRAGAPEPAGCPPHFLHRPPAGPPRHPLHSEPSAPGSLPQGLFLGGHPRTPRPASGSSSAKGTITTSGLGQGVKACGAHIRCLTVLICSPRSRGALSDDGQDPRRPINAPLREGTGSDSPHHAARIGPPPVTRLGQPQSRQQ